MSETDPRKRSRFDQTEPEPVRKSRFDRRSRSPVPARLDGTGNARSRSPVRSVESPADTISKQDAAARAAAAAAKINAQINAKKGIQHVDVPPIRSVSSALHGKNGDISADVTEDSKPQRGQIPLRSQGRCLPARRRLHQGYRSERSPQSLHVDQRQHAEDGKYALLS